MQKELTFFLNDKFIHIEINPAMTCLDYIRKEKHLTGTKEVCREGDCGACTILVGTLTDNGMNYRNINSCLLPLGSVDKKHIVTIEGLNQKGLNLIQQIFVEEGATQCGFCTPGFILSLTAYFLSTTTLNYNDAIDFISGNICRCTGHISIKRAVHKIIDRLVSPLCEDSGGSFNVNSPLNRAIMNGIVPEYFHDIIDNMRTSFIDDKEPDEISLLKLNVAGGTDLYVQKGNDIIDKEINLIADGIIDYEKIYISNNNCVINANSTITEFGNSEIIQKIIPDIKNFLKYFGSIQIRNRATIGGNISNASPIADITNILLALNSNVIIEGLAGYREMPLNKFFISYKNIDLAKDELIKEISFKIPEGIYKFNYEKVSRRTMLDIASVNCSILLFESDEIIHNIYISAGGVAPVPLFLEKTREFLLKKPLNNSSLNNALSILQNEIAPISDIRGSAEYKKLLLRQLFVAHFVRFYPNKNFGEIIL